MANKASKKSPNALFESTNLRSIKKIKIFPYTRCITPKHVTSWRGPSPCHCACWQLSSYRRNAAAVASRWQHCVRFNRSKISTSDLPLRRRTCYRSTKRSAYTALIYSINNSLSVFNYETYQWVETRVVNGPTSSGQNPARPQKYKPEPEN